MKENKKYDSVKIKGITGICVSFTIVIIHLLKPNMFSSSFSQFFYDVISIIVLIISLGYFYIYIFKTTNPKEYERFKKYK